MSKKNNIEEIALLFKQEFAELENDQLYKDRRSKLNYTCRYGESHSTTLASWKRGRRCSCYNKWQVRLKGFSEACVIIEKYNGKMLSSLNDYKNAHSPILFINCSGTKVKISTNNLKLCTKLDSLKEDIITFYVTDRKISDVVEHFKLPNIAMALRLCGANNTDSNRFKELTKPTKEVLVSLYWTEKNHPSKIAKIYNCSSQTIVKWLKSYSIKLRTKSEARQGKLNPIYDVGHTDAAKEKMSLAFSNGRKIGYHTNWGKPSRYVTPNQGEVLMRSGWEVKTANFLTGLHLDWLYEPETFRLDSTTSYRPDFYLPDENLYIEVKGKTLEQDKYKIDLFKELGYNILLWDAEELLKRGIINNSGRTDLNRKYRDKELHIGLY